MPVNRAAQVLCTAEGIRAYQFLETVFYEHKGNPVPMLTEEVRRLGGVISQVSQLYADGVYVQRVSRQPKELAAEGVGTWERDIREQTGRLYSNLFERFDDRAYFQEAADLLRQRIEKNGLSLDWLKGKKGLDAGCGGGRYTVALTKLGARDVTGIDYGKGNIRDARRRAQNAAITNVHFRHADVLNIPYGDRQFDFVFSNGVLHHTTDPRRGLQEVFRVLRPGGFAWLFLYGKSLWWDMVELIRVLVAKTPHEVAHYLMFHMGYAPSRIFKFLDSLYVPILQTYTAKEVREMLESIGFVDFQQLPRCVKTKYYRGVNEMLWSREKYAKTKWGEGELRFLMQKPDF
ncbi:MAG: methyltransferase domain-containing protein [Deltaproteobacteria bacterium]|nr:methyltransferase domain-containing protein [Deltaproteobacteria bacterium]